MTKKILEYKGFQGSVDFSLENNILFGKILHIEDLISFDADDVRGLQASFEEAVEDYLETCESLGVKPDKPYSGTLNVRIGPTLHRQAARKAVEEEKSINDLIKEAVDCHLNGRHQEIHHHYESAATAFQGEYSIKEAPSAERVKLKVVR